MRFLALGLVSVISALGQVCPVTPEVDIINSKYIHLGFNLAPAHSANGYRIGYDTAITIGMKAQRIAISGTDTYMDYNVENLAPGTKYYFDWEITTDGGATYSTYLDCQAEQCPSGVGSQPGGYECEDIGAGILLPFITTPSGTDVIQPPSLPVHGASFDEPPAITGSTINATCATVQASMNACAALDTSLNHEILLPSAKICQPQDEGRIDYDLPAKIGAGYCVIRCADHASNDLPPIGVTPSPDMLPNMCGLSFNDTDNISNTTLINTDGLPAHGTQGWIFDRITLQMPPHETVAQQVIAITAFDSVTGVITTASNHGLFSGQSVRVAIPGIEEPKAQQGQDFATFPAVNQIDIGNNFTGTYPGTGGYIASNPSVAIVSCTSAVEPVCATASNHALVDHFEYTLTSIVSGTLTLSTPHKWGANMSIRIFGSDAGACDGLWRLTAVNQGAGTATVSSAPDCTNGTAVQTSVARIFGLSGVTPNGEGFIVSFPTSTTVKLYRDWENNQVDWSAAGAITGGYMAVDPIVSRSLATFFRCDRCAIIGAIFYGDGVQRMVNWVGSPTWKGLGETGAVNNSLFIGSPPWFVYDGVAGVANYNTMFPTFSMIPSQVSAQSSDDFQQLRNIEALTGGFTHFADNNGNLPCAEDVTIAQNDHWVSELRRTGTTGALGLAYNYRQPIEWKCIDTLLVTGNTFANQPAVGVRQVYSYTTGILGAQVDGPRGDTDITHTYNLLYRQTEGFLFGTRNRLVCDTCLAFATDGVNISNNFVYTNFDFGNNGPSGQAMEIPGPWTGFEGQFLTIGSGLNVTVGGNTYLNRDNNFPVIIRYPGGSFMQSHAYVDNLFLYNQPTNFSFRSGFECDTTNRTTVPAPSGNNYSTCYANSVLRNGVADPSSIWDNVIIPGTADSTTNSFGVVNNMYSEAQTEIGSCGGPSPSN